MVFNSVMLISAAKKSAEAWQQMACIDENQRIDGQQMVDLVLCFPLQQLGHLLLYLWTFLCVPPHPTYYVSSSYYDDDDDDDDGNSDDEDGEGFRYVYYSQASPDDDSSSGSD
ncbi:OLC1v1007727C1 [Oldenlandia corymbosa var. corymbosa]|uniref:OLC1v1007727C1 n=1 Tax=Oldenlandia corymbosa var. corymbosa TaxID=529605 RepID=A0AAV1DMN9_OLDCO|nr:OLC1v1007727C1 [Oldenlandia corymbosa var. corymbosa]